ncbi:MAG: hypothetical protein AB7S70_12225 [Hyphomicrobium sp.]|uniref:hypothetical protein n=1 Tax=Hyphomicrobium sp. TaxID=82 RepID=UPI003D0FBF9E
MRSMRVRGILWAAACVPALLGGCATMQDFAGIPRTGYQGDGTYVVSPQEEGLACRQIKERLEILTRKLQILPAEAAYERETTPATVGSAIGRMFGGKDDGLKATDDYKRAQAESDALKALIARKQCV